MFTTDGTARLARSTKMFGPTPASPDASGITAAACTEIGGGGGAATANEPSLKQRAPATGRPLMRSHLPTIFAFMCALPPFCFLEDSKEGFELNETRIK